MTKIDVGYRLSPQQKRIWTLHGALKTNPFSARLVVRIEGEIEFTTLLDRFKVEAQRHMIFRTLFHKLAGMTLPLQVISEQDLISIHTVEPSALVQATEIGQVDALLKVVEKATFNLEKGPLFYLFTCSLSPREHLMVASTSAMCADQATLGYLVDLLEACLNGQDEDEIELNYADLSEWLNETLEPEDEEGLDYWKNKPVAQAFTVKLPLEGRANAEDEFRPIAHTMELKTPLFRNLKKLATHLQVSQEHCLLATWYAFLWRLDGPRQIVSGVHFDGRNYEDLEGIPGIFSKYLPLEANLGVRLGFGELAQHLSNLSEEATQWQEYFHWDHVEREGNHSDFFPYCFEVINLPQSRECSGVTLKVLHSDCVMDRFKLRLSLETGEDQPRLNFHYDPAFFSESGVKILSGQFECLLAEAAAKPDCVLGDLKILGDQERLYLLKDWNQTGQSMPQTILPYWFESQVLKSPEAIAVTYKDQHMSYTQLDALANKLAAYLQDLGIAPESRVGICLGRTPDLLVALLGVMKAGGCYVPMDPAYPVDRLSYIAEDSRLLLLISDSHLDLPSLASDPKRVYLDRDRLSIEAKDPGFQRPEIHPDQAAYVIYTSGSTGRPKGVMISHGSLAHYLDWSVEAYELKDSSGSAVHSSMAFDATITSLFTPLISGRPVCLIPEDLDITGLAQALGAANQGLIKITPAHLDLIRDQLDDQGASLEPRIFVVGGEALTEETLAYWRPRLDATRLVNEYGPTETVVGCAFYEVGGPHASGLVPIGKPIARTDLYALDQQMKPVAIGMKGELFIGGSGVARGYLDRPGLTAERFTPHPYSDAPGARLYKTGDLVRHFSDGNLLFLGRNDDQVNIHGFRIELGEIEAVLRDQVHIHDGVVTVHQDDTGEPKLIAWVVIETNHSLDGDNLRTSMAGILPHYMIPSRFISLDAMPLTVHGKVDRGGLPDPSTLLAEQPQDSLPQTPIQDMLTVIWEQLLKIDKVDTHTSFFELGGHSLLAVQVITRIRETFGVEPSIQSLFRHPTIAQWAEIVEAAQSGNTLSMESIERVSRSEPLELSIAQEMLWLQESLRDQSNAYNISSAYFVHGSMDLGAVIQSFKELSNRHEILRTHFEQVNGRPIQIIDEFEDNLNITVINLESVTKPDRQREIIESIAYHEARKPFDLTKGPLMRVQLLRTREKENVLLLTFHHLIYDGWSISIFINELLTIYDAFTRGEPSPLEPLPIQYADYAHWERQWMTDEFLDEQLSYWREHLADMPTSLHFPKDKPRPAVQSFQGQVESMSFSPDLCKALHDVGREEGASLFMVLMTAYQALLASYCDQETLSVSFPITNRPRRELENLIGLFLNTLVLRTDIQPGMTFKELLIQVRDRTLTAYSHKHAPFSKVVETVVSDRHLSHAHLAQARFVLQNSPEGRLEHQDLEFKPMPLSNDTSKYDLLLDLTESEAGLTGFMQFDSALFLPETMRMIRDHFSIILEKVVAKPDAPIHELLLLDKPDHAELDSTWNPRDLASSYQPFHKLFEQECAKRPDESAVTFNGESLSFRELNIRANRLAHYLIGLGVQPETPVGLALSRSLNTAIGLLAIAKAGGVYVPIDYTYPKSHIAWLVDDVVPAHILSESNLVDDLPNSDLCILLDKNDVEDNLNSYPETNPKIGVYSENLAYIIYTSGSTGRPKGVGISHHALSQYIKGVMPKLNLKERDIMSSLASMATDMGHTVLFGALATGRTLRIIPTEYNLEPDKLSAHLASEKVDCMKVTPSHLQALLSAASPGDLLPNRTLVLGGEACRTDLVQRIRDLKPSLNIVNHYGPTEATVGSLSFNVPLDWNSEHGGTAPIGGPFANTQGHIVNSDLHPVHANLPGELLIGGETLARGYVNRPSATAERFTPDPFSKKAGARVYRTGDRVRRLPNGSLIFMGRVDDQLKINGFRVEPGEIAHVLKMNEAVKEAVVLGKDDGKAPRLIAYVVLESEQETSAEPKNGVRFEDDLNAYLTQKMPSQLIPSHFVILENIPLTPNGKFDRRALLALEIDRRQGDNNQKEPQSRIEKELADIWKELLEKDQVWLDDHFFKIGGHSLLSLLMITRIREDYALEVSFKDIFENPTLFELAAHIENAVPQCGQREAVLSLEPAPDGATIPLSFAQQRLWFLGHLEGLSATYNMPSILRLSGKLDIEALKQAVNTIIVRHDILRTSFIDGGQGPRQVISDDLEFDIPVFDVNPMNSDYDGPSETELVDEFTGRPFALGNEPLVRAALIRVNPDEHLFMINMHHIISDGWSHSIFINEFVQLYRAFSENTPSPLEALPIQYSDYAYWQRRWLGHEALEAQIDFWKSRLEGVPSLLTLPTDFQRPKIKRYQGSGASFTMPRPLLDKLEKLAREQETSLFVLLLTAFNVFLSRYSGQNDIAVGSPVANRNRRELEHLIGFFVNTVVFRTRVPQQGSFKSLLDQVHQTALETYDHQDIPFEKLIDLIQPERSLSHTPLFQTLFSLRNTPKEDLRLPGIEVSPYEWRSGVSKFDLSFIMEPKPQGLLTVVEFDTDLFKESTIIRMVAHFEHLLEQIAIHPMMELSDISLLLNDEVRLIETWNNTARNYAKPPSLSSLVEEQVEKTPNAVALVFEDKRLTYTQLNDWANRLAHRLLKLGATKDKPIGVCMERSPDMVTCLLASQKAGCAYLPLDPSLPLERLNLMVKDSGTSILLTHSGWSGQFDDEISICCLDVDDLAGESPRNPDVEIHPENTAYIIYTSGSTGRPKGVSISQQAICNRLLWMKDQFRISNADRVVQKTPIGFDVSVWEFFWPLITGARLIVARPDGHQDPQYLQSLIEREDVSVIHFVPSMLSPFLDSAQSLKCASLKMVVCSGEELGHELTEGFYEALGHTGAKLYNFYGPTEAAVEVTWRLCLPGENLGRIPIGKPIANTQIHVLDESMNRLPIGVSGQIFLAGANLARGYVRQPGQSAEQFRPNPYSKAPGSRMYATGDLGRYKEDGEIEYLGRLDHQVKIHGHRIEIREVEHQLLSNQEVIEAAVIYVEDNVSQRLAAFVRHNGATTVERLRQDLANKLPKYMVPTSITTLDAFPLSPNGKLDRKELSMREAAVVASYKPPRTEKEVVLASIWSDVLKRGNIGIQDNFFNLGGDSILSLQVIARANNKGMNLAPRDIFEYQTIESLARFAGARKTIVAEQEPVLGEIPHTPIQHWFFEQELVDVHHWNQAVMLTSKRDLNVSALDVAMTAIMDHHDMLRARFTKETNGWRQSIIQQNIEPAITAVDLSDTPDEALRDTIEAASLDAQRGLNLENGPLMRVVHFQTGSNHLDRLLIVIHHLVIDGVSWRILLEDFQGLYQQALDGAPARLGRKTTSFKEWSRRLSNEASSAAREEDRAFWRMLAAKSFNPLPRDGAGENTRSSARAESFALDESVTRALLEKAPRAYRTEVNDILLTALLQAVTEWTGDTRMMLDLEGHGREDLFEDVDLTRTVGWFTTMYPVSLDMSDHQDLGNLLKSVKEQLRRIPQRGMGYGLARYLSQDGLPGDLQPEILFNYQSRTDGLFDTNADFAFASESTGDRQSLSQRRAHLLEINGLVVDGCLKFELRFSKDIHDRITIRKVMDAFRIRLEKLTHFCLRPEHSGRTPSDFPETNLDQSFLDRLTSRFSLNGQINIQAIYPLTALQDGMIYHSLEDKAPDTYMEQLICDLGEGFDSVLFKKAWERVNQQFGVLRTVFVRPEGEEAIQVVCQETELSWREEDWRRFEPEERDSRWEALSHQERKTGFDISKAPPTRFVLIRLEGNLYRFMWLHHHALLDGWSKPIITGELFRHFNALRDGQQAAVKMEKPYREYIRWLMKQDKEEARNYWREYLQGIEAPSLLAGEPHHRGHTADMDSLSLKLDRNMTRKLKEFVRRERLTMNILTQAAWSTLLIHYQGRQDVVFGQTVSGRPPLLEGVETMVGLFINTLPVRAHLSENVSMLDWMKSLHQTQIHAEAYGYLPLVEIRQCCDVPADMMLFDTLFVFENYPVDAALKDESAGVEIRDVRFQSRTNFSMSLIVSAESEVHIEFLFDQNRFHPDVVSQMADCYRQILRRITEDPGMLVQDAPTLLSGQLQRLLTDWNETENAYPRGKTIHAQFREQAMLAPDHTAVIWDDQEITYGQLERAANALAYLLGQNGVREGNIVALCMGRRIELIIAILATLKTGGAYLYLDPAHPADRKEFMLTDTCPTLILTADDETGDMPSQHPRLLDLATARTELEGQPNEPPTVRVTDEHLAYVIYTSGSSGQPKGVMIPHRGVLNLTRWQAKQYRVTKKTRVSQFASFNFDGSVGESFMALLNGLTLIMLDRFLDPEDLVASVNRTGVNMMVLIPSIMKEMDPVLFEHQKDLMIVAVGEACPTDLASAWSAHCHFMNAYGPTEYTVYSHLWSVDQSELDSLRSVPIGTPMFNTASYVLDKRLRPVPLGAVGELYLSGVGAAWGYQSRPGLTAQKFIPNPFEILRLYKDGGELVEKSALEELGRFREQHLHDQSREGAVEIEAMNKNDILNLLENLEPELQTKSRCILEECNNDPSLYEGFLRYLLEAVRGSYASIGIGPEVLSQILPFESFHGLKGVDLGMGNGEIMKALRALGAQMTGVDLGPLFVSKAWEEGFEAVMARVDTASKTFSEETGLEAGSCDFAISTLVLDRLKKPEQMLRNMFHILKDGGCFALQTLLPVIGRDDGDLDDPIIYTPEACRVTPGLEVEEDKQFLIRKIRDLGGRSIKVYSLPYVVSSGDGVQEYRAWSFCGEKENAYSQTLPKDSCYNRMYRTGDLARYLPDGRLEFCGRVDAQVKIRGIRLEPGEIETVLRTHPKVEESVVFPWQDQQGQTRLMAYVVNVSGEEPEGKELRLWLAQRFPDYMIPSGFVQLDAIPLTNTGKLNTHALPAPDWSTLASGVYEEPKTDLEHELARIWSKILGVALIGRNDNFFELGGHSLLATRITSRIRDQLNIKLKVPSIFTSPTVAALAEHITALQVLKSGQSESLEDQTDYEEMEY